MSIAYAVLGDGPIDLVFVGGFVSHLEIAWEAEPVRHFFERLAAFARVIVWDKREQGARRHGAQGGAGRVAPVRAGRRDAQL